MKPDPGLALELLAVCKATLLLVDVLLVEAVAVTPLEVELEAMLATVADVVTTVTLFVAAEVATTVVFANGIELPLPVTITIASQLLVNAAAISAMKGND